MKYPLLLLIAAIFTLQFEVNAQLVLTLSNVNANTTCDEVWMEEGLALSFVNTTVEDCNGGGSCFFGIEVEELWLYPSRMTVDVSSLQHIQSVEIDVEDFCGVNCTRAFLYDGTGAIANAGNMLVSSPETLTLLNPGEGALNEIAVSSCEGKVAEIRINLGGGTGIEDIASSPFVIFPNPVRANDDLIISNLNKDLFEELQGIEIYDLNGKMIYNQKQFRTNYQDQIVIPAERLSNGFLFVHFNLDDRSLVRKVMRL